MISSFIQLQVDTLSQAIPEAADKLPINTEISVLEFIFKGGFFLIPIAILLFYTLYLVFERIIFIKKVAKIDRHLIADIRNNLNAGNLDLALSVAERSNSALGNVLA